MRERRRRRRRSEKKRGRTPQMKERALIRRNVIIKEYHEQLFDNKFDNSDEKDEFPEGQKLSNHCGVSVPDSPLVL